MCIIDLPGLHTIPFLHGLYGSVHVGKEWTRLHGQHAGLWPSPLAMQASRCWHGTHIMTDKAMGWTKLKYMPSCRLCCAQSLGHKEDAVAVQLTNDTAVTLFLSSQLSTALYGRLQHNPTTQNVLHHCGTS